MQYAPWTILKKDSMGDVVQASGLVFEMLNEIASTLNFTYSVLPPDEGDFGFKKKGSNEYDGMVGQLINQAGIYIISSPYFQAFHPPPSIPAYLVICYRKCCTETALGW